MGTIDEVGMADQATNRKGMQRNAELFQRPPSWQRRLLEQPDDLSLVERGISHVSLLIPEEAAPQFLDDAHIVTDICTRADAQGK